MGVGSVQLLQLLLSFGLHVQATWCIEQLSMITVVSLILLYKKMELTIITKQYSRN